MAGAWHRVFKARATETDGEPVKRLAPVALLALAALAGACGSGGAGPAADPAPELPDPAALVLHASDLGPGYVRQASATKPITLAHELLHESAAARAADRRAYLAGYSAGFARPAQVGIVSQVMTYRDAGAARIVIGDAQAVAHVTRQLHAHPVAVPPGAPGTPRLMLAGSLAGLPAYAYGWQRGAALELIAVFGRHVTMSRVIALARVQDARLTGATA
jgi:hypothetical protein